MENRLQIWKDLIYVSSPIQINYSGKDYLKIDYKGGNLTKGTDYDVTAHFTINFKTLNVSINGKKFQDLHLHEIKEIVDCIVKKTHEKINGELYLIGF